MAKKSTITLRRIHDASRLLKYLQQEYQEQLAQEAIEAMVAAPSLEMPSISIEAPEPAVNPPAIVVPIPEPEEIPVATAPVIPVADPVVSEPVQATPALTPEKAKELEQQTEEIIANGSFRELHAQFQMLNHLGLWKMGERLKAEMARRNRVQAEQFAADHDAAFDKFFAAIEREDLEGACGVSINELHSIREQLDRMIPHVAKQLATLRNTTTEGFRQLFEDQMQNCDVALDDLRARIRAKRQQAIDEVLQKGVDARQAAKMRDIIGRFHANLQARNQGGARKCALDLIKDDNYLAIVSHFKDKAAGDQTPQKLADELIRSAYLATAPVYDQPRKKSGRQLVRS